MNDETLKIYYRLVTENWKLFKKACLEINNDPEWWTKIVDDFTKLDTGIEQDEIKKFSTDLAVLMITQLQRIWEKEYRDED